MNKTFLIVLAICLVSVHGFVKRDAPPSATSLDNIKKQIQDLSEQFGKQFQDAFQPDTMKKNFDETVKKISSAIEQLQPKPEAPKK